MKNVGPEIVEQLNFDLRQIGYKYRNNLLEWTHVIRILEKEILPLIYQGVQDRLEALEQENKKLRAKINQSAFRNNPDRDRRIVELFKDGYSRGGIAREVGMSRWGVSKALRRLGSTRLMGEVKI